MRHSNSTVRSHETLEVVSTGEGPECPQFECNGRMQTNPMGNIVPLIGLQQVCCTHCNHQGMVSREGVRLLFRGGNEYLFSYGNSVTTLTVVLAAHAVDVFGSHGLGPDNPCKARCRVGIAERAMYRDSGPISGEPGLCRILPTLLCETGSLN